MGQLTNQYVSQSYQGLLKMTDSTQGVTGTLQTVQTGDGTNTPLQISQTQINISGSLTINGSPITGSAVDTGSFATTGSNIFTGNQLITGSEGYVTLDGSTAGTTDNSLLTVHANNDGPWIGRYFNDTFSSSSSVLSFWGDNDGTFHFHNESTASIKFGVNNYGDNFILNDTNTLSNRDLIVSGAIKTNGAIQWSNNAFNYSDNVSGALYFSTLNNGTLHLNDDGGEGDVFIGWGPNKTHIRGDVDITGSLGVTNIKGTGSLLLQPNQSDARYLEVYNTSPTDTHITGSGGQIFIGDDVTYVKVDNYGSTKRIDIVADNLVNVSGSMSVTGSVDITGQYLVNGVPFSGGSSGTSGTSGQSGSSGTSGSNGSSGTSGSNGSSGTSGNGSSGTSGTSGGTGSAGTSGSSGTSSAGGDRNGLITTGSLGLVQGIIGSITISEGLYNTGSLTEVGNVYMFSPSFNSGSVKLNITGSNAVSQSNLIFGNATGPAASNFTGSIIITGSNNILLQSTKVQPGTTGFNGYINGNNNILGVIPLYSTSSVDSVTTNNNILFSVPQFDLTTGSGGGTFNNNLTLGAGGTIVHRHKSGSISTNNNLFIGSLNSFASRSFFDGNLGPSPTIIGNIIHGTPTNLLQTSSSIVLSRNFSNTSTLTVNNQFTNPSNYTGSGSGSLSLNNNLFIGNTHTVLSSGSNSVDRTISNNLVAGYGNTLNQISSGSNNTYLINTAVLGQGLIVSGSNTSTTTTGGSTFVGRWNATGSLQETTEETVFVVGTGTNAANRRNAIHVDSNNNTRITGSVLIAAPLNAGHSPSLVIGSFNSGNAAANITGSVLISGSLSVNGSTISSVDRNGLITTGSNASGDQYITGGLIISSSAEFNHAGLTVQSGENTGRINVPNGNWLYKNIATYNTVIGDTAGINVNTPFESGSANNLIFTGFFLGFKSGSSNTVIAGAGGANFLSGSNNTILGTVGNLQFGNNNLLVGNPRTSTLMEGVISMGTNTSPDLLYKSGSVVQMGYSTQVTGSLNATNLSSATGYQDITATLSASLNLSSANVWLVDDDNNPDGAHLDVTNIIDGQQITILWKNNTNSTQTVTIGSNIYLNGAGSFNVQASKTGLIHGAVYGGTLYITQNL